MAFPAVFGLVEPDVNAGLDLYHVPSWSLTADLSILASAVHTVLGKEGPV